MFYLWNYFCGRRCGGGSDRLNFSERNQYLTAASPGFIHIESVHGEPPDIGDQRMFIAGIGAFIFEMILRDNHWNDPLSGGGFYKALNYGINVGTISCPKNNNSEFRLSSIRGCSWLS